jgi:branched-chain amino acid transport system substrate-binding protein
MCSHHALKKEVLIMKTSKVANLLIALAVILLALPVFSQSIKPSAPAGEPIKVGGSSAVTGLSSEQAKWVRAGIEAWAEDVNKRGGLLGRPVKLIIYDDESNADKAVTYYERAITVDKVDLVFGSHGTSNVALMPLVEKYGKVFIGQGGHMKSFDQGFTYSFGSPPLMGEWAYISVAGFFDDLIPKAQWPKTAAILAMNNVVGLSHVPNIVKVLENHEVKVVVNETYNLPLSDAAPLVSKAKARGAEILILPSFFDDTVMIMRAAKAQRYSPKIIWNIMGSRIPAWFKELGADGNYVIANTWWTPDLPYPGNDRINEAAKKLGLPQTPDFFGLGYIWMYSLEVAVQGAGTLDNKMIRDYMRSRPFDLPYGKGIRFDSKGLPAPFCFTVQARGGKNELIWPKDTATGKLAYPRPDWSK